MKSIFSTLILFFFLTYPFIGRSQKGSLTVRITNIAEQKGKILIGLYENEEQFKTDGDASYEAEVDATSNSVTYTFKNLPYKVYGIALQQDLNNDKKFNKNGIGYPLEPYGFSNNVKPFLSMPAFDKVKFKFDRNKEVVIELMNT